MGTSKKPLVVYPDSGLIEELRSGDFLQAGTTNTALSTASPHGFATSDAVGFVGSDWGKCQADDPETSELIGFVTSVPTTTSFNLATSGQLASGFTGLTKGATYYLSQSTPGEITATKPTSGIVKPVGVAINSTTILVQDKLGYDLG